MPASRYHTVTDQDKIQALQQHMERFGYCLVDTPIIDQADLFLTRAGDQLIEKLFTFERFGQQLTLRPEFTAAAAHHYAHKLSHENAHQPARLQFYGPIFVDNPQQTKHNYQQKSMGAELIGIAGSTADVEIMAMAAQGLQKIGVEGWNLTIGHISLMRKLLGKFGLDNRAERFLLTHLHLLHQPDYGKDYVLQQFNNSLPHNMSLSELAQQPELLSESNTQYMLDLVLDVSQNGMTMGGRDRYDIARRLLQKRKRVYDRQNLINALDFLEQWGQIEGPVPIAFDQIQDYVADEESRELLSQWRRSIEWLQIYGISLDDVVIQPSLARGWDYYTGIVFEITASGGEMLGGGGRYDELVSLMGDGRAVPAVGFAYYLDSVLEYVAARNVHVLSLDFRAEDTEAAIHWANILREKGLNVELNSLEKTHPDTDCMLKNGDLYLDGNRYTPAQVDQLVSHITL